MADFADLMIHEQYHKELVEEAEQFQLARQVLYERRSPALAWVGRRMIEIGAKLVGNEGKPDLSLN
jgi:hypothetical protein